MKHVFPRTTKNNHLKIILRGLIQKWQKFHSEEISSNLFKITSNIYKHLKRILSS